MDKHSRSPGQLIGAVGGEWDVEERRFVGPGRHARVWEITELQREATVYWFAWLRAYLTRDWATFEAAHGDRPFSLWTVGGRRRGKTWLGLRLLAAFGVACPEAFPLWLVSPIEDDFNEGKELHREWVKALPPSWYTWNRRELFIQLVNGVRVMMYSAHDAEKLKDGAHGYAFWNEVQKSNGRLRALNNVRGGAADAGTLVHCAANPPRQPDEYWIEDILEGLDRGQVEGKLLDFRGDNPYVNEASLDAMAAEMTERDYEIERGGARKPRPDIVLYEFADGLGGNVCEPPAEGEITEAFLQRKLGRPFAAMVQCDFQAVPHQVALVDRLWADPANPDDALSWTTHEVVLEQASEDDIIDALEQLGLRGDDTWRCLLCQREQVGVFRRVPASCPGCGERFELGKTVEMILASAVVADASGSYQQSDRKEGRITGRGSYDMFRARGWRHLFKPDPHQERNPHVDDRVAVGNARLRTADKRRHAFVHPRCIRTIEALKKWPNNKQGHPSRFSTYAHVGDAWTYGKYRLWPRLFQEEPPLPDAIKVVNIHRRDERAWP
jgi:hypothetical protein